MKQALSAIVTLAVLCAAPTLVEAQRRAASRSQGNTTDVVRAVAVLHPAAGHNVQGTVTFVEERDGVRVIADVRGLPPNSVHGFHIHEFGDCTAPDFTSAGDHYNPEGHPHAGPGTRPRHAGDLGNLVTTNEGRAYKMMTVRNISVGREGNNILGRAVIVHAQPDDLKSQPSGDAGARIACGVIGVAKDGVVKRETR